jgi:UDP-3-O-[3-hydroxymyristoyl] glucosamine N-acyltransferase
MSGPWTLGEIAKALDAPLEGDPGRTVRGVAALDQAGPDQISFVTSSKSIAAARSSRAGALIVPKEFTGAACPVIRTDQPQLAVITLLRLFHPVPPQLPGIHPTAIIADSARVHASAMVGPFVVIEEGATVGANVRIFPYVYVGERSVIGDGSFLYPGVVVREGVRLGRGVVVHPGVVIGSDGFGYAFDGSAHQKIPQVGGVVIEDEVEIGANTTIDRGSLGNTLIERGAKLDNLVQVAHHVTIGADALIAAQAGIAGSSRVGRRAVLAGQVGVADHVTIGDRAQVAAQSGVPNDVAPDTQVFGYPARPVKEARRVYAAMSRLPELLKIVRSLDRRLRELETRAGIAPDGGKESDGE